MDPNTESYNRSGVFLQTFVGNELEKQGWEKIFEHPVVIAPFNGVTRTTCFVLRPKSSEQYSYSVMLSFQEDTVSHANSHSKGATIPYAVWDNSLATYKVLLPELKILNKKYKISISGEGGEFESLVLNSPIHKSKIKVLKSEKIMNHTYSGYLKINKLKLIKK